MFISKTKALLLFIGTLFLFSGCSQYEQALLTNALTSQQSYASYPNSGYTQTSTRSYYRDGERDGCRSRQYNKTIKSSYKWNQYRTYRDGWREGYRKCHRKTTTTRHNYYKRGYDDGCRSKTYGSIRKESRLYRSDRNYRDGWREGYRKCYARTTTTRETITDYYKRGYSDGCWSKRHHTTRKDSRLYQRNRTYRDGWRKGYRNCHNKSNTTVTRHTTTNYYKRGYDDGCWSKRHHSTRKNSRLYRSDRRYRDAWREGYRSCTRRYY